MMVAHILFETPLGERFLAWLERRFGLAIVPVDQIEYSTAGVVCQSVGG